MGTCGPSAQWSPAPAAPQRDVSAQRALGSGKTGRHRLVWQNWSVWDNIALNQSWLSATAASGVKARWGRREAAAGATERRRRTVGRRSAKAEDDPTVTRGGGAVGRRSLERKRRGGAPGGAEADQEQRRGRIAVGRRRGGGDGEEEAVKAGYGSNFEAHNHPLMGQKPSSRKICMAQLSRQLHFRKGGYSRLRHPR